MRAKDIQPTDQLDIWTLLTPAVSRLPDPMPRPWTGPATREEVAAVPPCPESTEDGESLPASAAHETRAGSRATRRPQVARSGCGPEPAKR